MSGISITFGAPTKPHFNWYDSFEGLTDEELDEIVLHCRSATAAFFSELSDRRKPWKDSTLEAYYDQLRRNANHINEKGLTKEYTPHLQGLYLYLADPDGRQDKRNDVKVARHFLWLVSRVIDWSYALLILCSLGRHKVQKDDEDQRVKLIKYIAINRATLNCPRLEDEATQCKLYEIHIKSDPPLTRGCKKRMRGGSEDTTIDGTASVMDFQRENTIYVLNSEHCLRKQPFPIAYVVNDKANSSSTSEHRTASVDASGLPRDRIRASLVQVQRESRDASTLLALLCFLDGTNISEFMLTRVKEPRKVWSPSGEVQKVPVTGVGFNSDVLSLVSDVAKIDEAIKRLEAAELIASEPGAYGRRLHLDSATQLCLTHCMDDPLAWRLQALILVCHTFPMHRYVEPLYGNLGRLQINQIQYLADHYQLLGPLLSSPVKHKLAEVLLAASTFLDFSWKYKALGTVEAIMAGEPADYLQLWTKLRRFTLTGLIIGFEIEESAICNVGHTDARSNALYGELILSYVTNNIRRSTKLTHPRSILKRFSPLNIQCPSTMERLVLMKKTIAIGQIERYQGNFWRARMHLTPNDDDSRLDAVRGRTRISHLAGVLCELGEARKAEILLLEELKVLKKLDFPDSSSRRCLKLSLAEAFLQQNSLKEAEDTYLELKVEDCPNPTIVTGIEKLRLWMGLARISHLNRSWSKALTNWEKALRASEDCDWRAGFTQMVVLYSISHVKLMLGERGISESYTKQADELYRREGRQFWLTGLGTSWIDFIWRSLGHNPEIPNFSLE